MSKEAERVYLTTLMTDSQGGFAFPVSIPNQPFNIPKNSPYGEYHILAGPEPIIIGGEGPGLARVRYVGFVQLNVWIPKSKGTRPATVGEDAFRTLFQFRQGRDTSGSTYKFGALQSFSPQTKVGWECVAMRVPFHRDTIEPVQITL